MVFNPCFNFLDNSFGQILDAVFINTIFLPIWADFYITFLPIT